MQKMIKKRKYRVSATNKLVLITGSPRSGTTYIQRALSAVGCSIGHETMGTAGTSSCLFFMDNDGDYGAPRKPAHVGEVFSHYNFLNIFHQVRDPKRVIASRVPSYTKGNKAWLDRHKIVPADVKPNLLHAAQLWLRMTDIADALADFRYRIEDIDDEWDPLCEILGIPGTPLPDLPRDINKGTGFRKPKPFTWKDLEKLDKKVCLAVMKRATKYGYDVDE